jgi:hypothetical protein
MGQTKTKRKPWVMPEWMEPYRDLFQNTGGNPIEELMNDTETNGSNNVIRSALIISVDSQVTLLHRLRNKGFLSNAATQTDSGEGK